MIKDIYSENQNGKKLRESGKISDTCLIDLFDKKLTALGFPARNFGLQA